MDINGYKPSYGGLAGRSLVSLKNFAPEELFEILYSAKLLKLQQSVKERQTALRGNEILLIAKTAFSGLRIAFEIAVKQLGGTPLVLTLGGTQLETLLKDADFLPVIARYGISAIVVNTELGDDAELIRAKASVPVLNAHGTCGPCVALAAMMTCYEKFGRFGGKTLAIVGDLSEKSYIAQAAVKCGMAVRIVAPKELLPSREFADSLAIYGPIETFDNLEKGLAGVDAVYVASGSNLGENYKVTARAMSLAASDAIFLHPTPVNRETEADGEVCDGPNSAMLDMAGNVLHIQKAALALILGGRIER